MLSDILLEVIRNRDRTLHLLRDPKHQQILEKSKSLWIDYEPLPQGCISIGVDSSWNSKSFQGVDLYVVDAVAVDSHNIVQDKSHDHDVTAIKDGDLQNAALAMEIELLESVLNKDIADLVYVDGSLESKIIGTAGKPRDNLFRLLEDPSNLIFISKNSESHSHFGSMGAHLGDIYYFNHVSRNAGYSRPSLNGKYADKFGYFVEIFARLRHSTPIIKVEFSVGKTNGSGVDEGMVRRLMDMMTFHSVAGYPQCLAYAHDTCVVRNHDLDEIASIYGMKDEIGSRALLEG